MAAGAAEAEVTRLSPARGGDRTCTLLDYVGEHQAYVYASVVFVVIVNVYVIFVCFDLESGAKI